MAHNYGVIRSFGFGLIFSGALASGFADAQTAPRPAPPAGQAGTRTAAPPATGAQSPARMATPSIAASTNSATASQSSGISAETLAVMQRVKSADTDLLAVSEEDGRFLRVMVASSGARRALEIGGANGYSAIWIGLGLKQTGGHLTSIEYDPVRAKAAAENIKRAGLSDVVTVIGGDAFREIPKLTGEFDFVFLDAWKRDYKKFLDMVFPRMPVRGLFLAHNVVNKKNEMTDFLDAVQKDPRVFTSIVTPSGEGMSVTVKVR